MFITSEIGDTFTASLHAPSDSNSWNRRERDGERPGLFPVPHDDEENPGTHDVLLVFCNSSLVCKWYVNNAVVEH